VKYQSRQHNFKAWGTRHVLWCIVVSLVFEKTAKTDNRVNVTSTYTYDSIYELTQVTQGTNTTESYSYDPVGELHLRQQWQQADGDIVRKHDKLRLGF
jgi:hypothetical protein